MAFLTDTHVPKLLAERRESHTEKFANYAQLIIRTSFKLLAETGIISHIRLRHCYAII